MGLDIFDALSAAGEGLGVVGEEKTKIRDENRKAEFAEKLERQRLELQAQYDEAKEKRAEARERLKPAGDPEVVTGDNGTYIQRRRNSYGDVVSERPMDKHEIESFRNSQTKEKLSLESLVSDIGYKNSLGAQARATADNAPLDRELKRRLTEAQIRNYDEPNRSESSDTKSADRALLEEARSKIGKWAMVTDATTGKKVKKRITAEFAAEWLRQKGYEDLAGELYKFDPNR